MRPRACVAMKLTASSRRELGGDDEVALVLAVGIVDDDDHPAGADVLDRLLDRRELAHRAQPLDVLREDVDLEVDRVAGLERAERRRLERVRDERDGEAFVVGRRDGERRPVDGDRALLDAVAGYLRRSVEPRRARARSRRLPTPSTWPWTM